MSKILKMFFGGKGGGERNHYSTLLCTFPLKISLCHRLMLKISSHCTIGHMYICSSKAVYENLRENMTYNFKNQYLDALSQQASPSATLPPSEFVCVDIVFHTLLPISGSRIKLVYRCLWDSHKLLFHMT